MFKPSSWPQHAIPSAQALRAVRRILRGLTSLVGAAALLSASLVQAADASLPVIPPTNSTLTPQYHAYYNLQHPNDDIRKLNIAAAPQKRGLTLNNATKVMAGDGTTVQALALSGYGNGSTSLSGIATEEMPALDPLKFGMVLDFKRTADGSLLISGDGQAGVWFTLVTASDGFLAKFYDPQNSSIFAVESIKFIAPLEGLAYWNRMAVQFDRTAGKAMLSLNGNAPVTVDLPMPQPTTLFSTASKRFSTFSTRHSSGFDGQLRTLKVFTADPALDLAALSRRSTDAGYVPDFAFPTLGTATYTPNASDDAVNLVSVYPALELQGHTVALSVDSASANVCRKHYADPAAIMLMGDGACKLKATLSVTTQVVVSPEVCTTTNSGYPSYTSSTTCTPAVTEPRTATREITTTLAVTSPNSPGSTTISPSSSLTDLTKITLKVDFTPAGNRMGQPGAVYVAFIHSGTVFFMDSAGALSIYTGRSPTAYFTGSLSAVAIDLIKIPTDLSSLRGAQVIVGYGLGILGLADPFTNMLNNTTYNVVYTVP